ncbi:MAG: translation initiation factor [Prevotella sp.]|nr:translation initiation factor [Prevotella sp.]MCM1074208.1 translation initiation factor [Ruminococcus sp.]
MDWKDILLAKSAEMGIAPDENVGTVANESETPVFTPSAHPALHVVVERRGRGGKTATIVEGFECEDAELKKIAARLKSSLCTGGSARGGEILIQGDCRDRVRQCLKSMGFKLKG